MESKEEIQDEFITSTTENISNDNNNTTTNEFQDFLNQTATITTAENSNGPIPYRHTAEELAAILSLSPNHQSLESSLRAHSNALAGPSSGVNYWPLDPHLQILLNEPHVASTSLIPPHLYSPLPNLSNSNGPSSSTSSSSSSNTTQLPQVQTTTTTTTTNETTSTEDSTLPARKKPKPNHPPSATFTLDPILTSNNTNPINRTFPPNVPILNEFPRLYRRFPVSSAFIPPSSNSSTTVAGGSINYVWDVVDLNEEETLIRSSNTSPPENSGRGAKWSKSCDPLNIFSPRFVKGEKAERQALCPICIESVERGGEGEMKWLKLKNSAYVYHMSYYHGVSVSGLPFSPPIDTRTQPLSKGLTTTSSDGTTITAKDSTTVPGKKVRKKMIEGHCHKCLKWIMLQSSKDTNTNVPEIFWWKHAKSCHADTFIPLEADYFLLDPVLTMILRKKQVAGHDGSAAMLQAVTGKRVNGGGSRGETKKRNSKKVIEEDEGEGYGEEEDEGTVEKMMMNNNDNNDDWKVTTTTTTTTTTKGKGKRKAQSEEQDELLDEDEILNSFKRNHHGNGNGNGNGIELDLSVPPITTSNSRSTIEDILATLPLDPALISSSSHSIQSQSQINQLPPPSAGIPVNGGRRWDSDDREEENIIIRTGTGNNGVGGGSGSGNENYFNSFGFGTITHTSGAEEGFIHEEL